MNLKEELYKQCDVFISNRFETIQKTIEEIQESLTTETKSTAGDKHETGRAMLQLEREKTGSQLAEIQTIKTVLSKIDVGKSTNTVSLGSIVYTSNLNYFIAISAGELKVGNETFYAVSVGTPIGQLLIGKVIDDEIVFRNQKFVVEKIL
ncbi:3-oxoacyl-ACP synthase [Seonamhaeicola marinus]|uniref:3-oxoacyl-ACP synthase n=1 Tax=Seonamhaeicola marinus TaxID=1912246 RepID=A0A5D0HSC0_9FLAO|nr:3-oxoacyl-ACP synthase [Seonamhaeicola marinus]TYA74253.1 3-oxoacyl-ACP synthase [Seonamhaeicola marinus]